MRFDLQSVRDAQRQAYDTLTQREWKSKNGPIKNPYFVRPENVSIGAQLIQEQAFVNTTSAFSFDFSINAPQPSATLNNVLLGKNNIFCFYAIQILIGEGATANNRIYRSRGIQQNDDSLYNSTVTMKFEQATLIDKMNGQNFRDISTNPNEFWTEAGLYLINPQRIITGELGVLNLSINLLNSISALTLSANLFISARLHGAFGQASATR